jgi:uncharacterized protein (TIGR02466 family)
MQPRIDAWFPVSIFILDDVCKDTLDVLEQKVKEVVEESGTYSNEFLAVNSTHKTNDSLHKLTEFSGLSEEILKNGKIFLVEMGWDTKLVEKLDISNMWANVSSKGQFVMPHIHPGCVLSGAFYIKKDNSSKITFFKNVYDMINFRGTFNSLSYPSCSYDCEPGRLMLWKSDLLHGTDPQQDGEKIVISFNLEWSHNRN